MRFQQLGLSDMHLGTEEDRHLAYEIGLICRLGEQQVRHFRRVPDMDLGIEGNLQPCRLQAFGNVQDGPSLHELIRIDQTLP